MRDLAILPRPGRLRPTADRDLFEDSKTMFERYLRGENRSEATVAAYTSDLAQFIAWLREHTPLDDPRQVERTDVTQYMAALGERKLSGVTRGRKLAALRVYFNCLIEHELIAASPANDKFKVKKERKVRNYLTEREYGSMLERARNDNRRDHAILQVFLQTGVRAAELCALELSDIDLEGKQLRVRAGKGDADRQIPLEKKAGDAIKAYLKERPDVPYRALFLSRQYAAPLSTRGVQKIVDKYRTLAGIERAISCHSLRHTFATYKVVHGVSPFQLMKWLGHTDLRTTMLYVHLGREEGKRMMEATSL